MSVQPYSTEDCMGIVQAIYGEFFADVQVERFDQFDDLIEPVLFADLIESTERQTVLNGFPHLAEAYSYWSSMSNWESEYSGLYKVCWEEAGTEFFCYVIWYHDADRPVCVGAMEVFDSNGIAAGALLWSGSGPVSVSISELRGTYKFMQ